jgi:hypothetical protein
LLVPFVGMRNRVFAAVADVSITRHHRPLMRAPAQALQAAGSRVTPWQPAWAVGESFGASHYVVNFAAQANVAAYLSALFLRRPSSGGPLGSASAGQPFGRAGGGGGGGFPVDARIAHRPGADRVPLARPSQGLRSAHSVCWLLTASDTVTDPSPLHARARPGLCRRPRPVQLLRVFNGMPLRITCN